MINHGEHGVHGESSLIECSDDLIGEVISAAIDVHRVLGPGLLESVYEQALAFELSERNIRFLRQVEVPVIYRGHDLGTAFIADMIVDDGLLLELKAIEAFTSVHLAQVMSYLRLLNIKRGLLFNFNTKLLRDGIKRVSI